LFDFFLFGGGNGGSVYPRLLSPPFSPAFLFLFPGHAHRSVALPLSNFQRTRVLLSVSFTKRKALTAPLDQLHLTFLFSLSQWRYRDGTLDSWGRSLCQCEFGQTLAWVACFWSFPYSFFFFPKTFGRGARGFFYGDGHRDLPGLPPPFSNNFLF